MHNAVTGFLLVLGSGVVLAGPIPVVSDFSSGAEGWTTADLFGLTVPRLPTWDSAGFISTYDTHAWNVFSAPDKFLGNKAAYVGGTLSLSLSDSMSDPGSRWPVVIITDNVTFLSAKPFTTPGTSFTHYGFDLTAAAWRTSDSLTVTSTQFSAVMGNLKSIYVNADFRTDGNDYARLDSVRLAAATPGLTPATITTRPSPDFHFPLRGSTQVYLTTEPGGVSSVYDSLNGYTDPYHAKDKGYYALDFSSERSEVVAAKSGRVVRIYLNEKGQPVITIFHPDISKKGSYGYFTEYGEFTALSSRMSLLLKNCGAADGTIACANSTDATIETGAQLGTLTGGHLHFQVKMNTTGNAESVSDFGTGLSKYDASGTGLSQVTLAGRAFDSWQLRKDGAACLGGFPLCPQSVVYGSATLPILSRDINGSNYNFGFNVASAPVYVDPPIAIGFEYVIRSGPLVRSVSLPVLKESHYEIWLWDSASSRYFFFGIADPEKEILLSDLGVSRFRVLGIDPTAEIDPDSNEAFKTRLFFLEPGLVEMSMTPLVASVPEPETYALLLAGVGFLGLATRKR